MMKRYQKIYQCGCISLLLIMASGFLFGQSFSEDVKVIHQKYANAKSLYAKMQMSGYEGSLETEPTFSQETKIYRQDEEVLYIMGNVEFLLNDKMSLWVNKELRKIICTTRNGNDELSSGSFDAMLMLDSLLSHYGEADFIGVENGLKHYRVAKNNREIVQNDIFISNSDKSLKKIIYTYNPERYPNKSWLEIEIKEMTLNGRIEESKFSTSNYIYKDSEGVWVPVSKYKGYEVILTNID